MQFAIQLLNPTGVPKSIVETEHKSLWKDRQIPDSLSGLTHTLFSKKQLNIIQGLITSDEWIIEESNDLINMVISTLSKS